MHGDVAYCKKHGHDWKKIDHGYLEDNNDILWSHVKCQRCGINHILYSFFEDVEQ